MSTGITRRRWKARKLREQGLSYREIAQRMHCSISTAHSYSYVAAGAPEIRPVAGLQDEHGNPVSGAEPGNTRSLSHGAYSERRLAPVREQHARQLAERYPWVDPGRRAVQAQRLAQIELGAAWLDGVGDVVRDEDGNVFDVANKVSLWSGQAERWFERAEAERREHRRYDALAEVMSDREESDGGAA